MIAIAMNSNQTTAFVFTEKEFTLEIEGHLASRRLIL
jgi:hypothetical protein